MHATTLLTLFTLPFSLAAPAPAPLNPSPPTDLHATTPPDVPLPDSVLPMLLAKFGGSLPAGMTKSPAPLIRMWIRGDDGSINIDDGTNLKCWTHHGMPGGCLNRNTDVPGCSGVIDMVGFVEGSAFNLNAFKFYDGRNCDESDFLIKGEQGVYTWMGDAAGELGGLMGGGTGGAVGGNGTVGAAGAATARGAGAGAGGEGGEGEEEPAWQIARQTGRFMGSWKWGTTTEEGERVS